MTKASEVKEKAFFFIFKGFSVAESFLRPESAPLRFVQFSVICIYFLVPNKFLLNEIQVSVQQQILHSNKQLQREILVKILLAFMFQLRICNEVLERSLNKVWDNFQQLGRGSFLCTRRASVVSLEHNQTKTEGLPKN